MTLTQNGVITEEAMLAYLNGTLTPEDTAKFEHLLEEDPFAREALEGLQTSNAVHLKTTFKELNQTIAERSGTEQQVSSINLQAITRYAIAAALIGLMVGLGFLIANYINNQPKQLAMEATQLDEENVPEALPLMQPEEVAVVDSVVEPATTDSTQSEDFSLAPISVQEFRSTEPELKQVTKTEPKVEPSAKKAEVIVADIKREDEKKAAALLAKERSTKTTPVTASGGAVAAAPNVPSRAQSDDMNSTAIAAKSKSNAREEIASDGDGDMDVAMQSFNSHDYKAASNQFNKILDKEPENKDALYFQSVSEYINGNSKGALKGFEKLLDQNSKHVEGSKYYKSQILLKKGKKEEARALLEELSRSNGVFKQRAVEKLGELE